MKQKANHAPMTNSPKIKIFVLTKEHRNQVDPVKEFFGDTADFLFAEKYDPAELHSIRPDLLLCTHVSRKEILICIDEARRLKIPSLFIQDGVLEWRCQYENPYFGSGGGAPQHQPVLTDKIACIGAQSARQIAAWGNAEKVEITGMPRLDFLLNKKFRTISKPGKKILVMTARKPWFVESHKPVIMESLKDLKEAFDKRNDIEILWRLTRDIEEVLGVQNHLSNMEGAELFELINAADAVITTPSTAGLEAMLLGRPTAFLDYFNNPRFIPTAWTISSKDHIETVIQDILNPPVTKLVFQKDSLSDALRFDRPAVENVHELILKMIEAGRYSRAGNQPLALQKNMLGGASVIFVTPPAALAALYPQNKIFSENNIENLQTRLTLSEKINKDLQKNLATRSIGYWVDVICRFLVRQIKSRKKKQP